MNKLALIMAAPALALVGACGDDSSVEETGDALEQQADAVEDLGDERAEQLEEMADDASTDAREDALNARAEKIDDVGDERADALNETADEME